MVQQLTVGANASVKGNITTLVWTGVRPAESIERAIGYAPGRLSAGYWLLLLKAPLVGADFELAGTTLRSGGKVGLPGSTPAEESSRKTVQKQIEDERGRDGYLDLKAWALANGGAITGPNRLAKIIAVTGDDPHVMPNIQYPMGGGGLQWNLVAEKEFLVAMRVDASGLAVTPHMTAQLRAGLPADIYDNRAKLIRYLEKA